MPSELISFTIKKNFDVGISTYSSSINSLKNYIDKIYNIDDTVINFKKNIFRLFALFEIAKEINANVITNYTMLESLFKKCYNFKSNNEYYFNYSDKKYKNYIFNKANYIIKIGKEIKNEHIEKNLLNNNNDVLYLKIENEKIWKNMLIYMMIIKTIQE